MKSVIRVGVLVLVGVLAVGVLADSSFGQQPGGRGRGRGSFGGFGGGFGGFGGQNNVTAVLQDENARNELDLVEEQISKIREIGEKLREDTQSQYEGFDFRSLGDLSPEERDAKFAPIRKKVEEVNAAAQKDIDAVLLPHQRERLKQLVVQWQMRGGAERALRFGPLGEELSVTDEQKEKLEAKNDEVQAALNEKIAKLRQDADADLISVLSPEQQAKLKGMIGTPFTFSQPQFSGFGGGDGGRGRGDGGRRGRGDRNNNDN